MLSLPNNLLMPNSRRSFLQGLGGGFGMVAWNAMQRSALSDEQKSSRRIGDIDPLRPLAQRIPHFAPKATSVIFLFLVGGPSQIDTFDYKPLLKELADKPVPKPVREAVQATRFANVFHGCEDKILQSP